MPHLYLVLQVQLGCCNITQQLHGIHRKPRSINMPNAQSVGNPHPDATGINKAAGIDVLLVLQYTRKNLSGPTYMV